MLKHLNSAREFFESFTLKVSILRTEFWVTFLFCIAIYYLRIETDVLLHKEHYELKSKLHLSHVSNFCESCI